MSTDRRVPPAEPAPVRFMTLRELRHEDAPAAARRKAPARRPRVVLRTLRA